MSRATSALPRLGLGLMALPALPLALLAYGYLLGLAAAPEPVSANRVPGLLPAHAALGATALILGFLQLIPRLRDGHPASTAGPGGPTLSRACWAARRASSSPSAPRPGR